MTEYEKLSDIELQRLASMEDRGAEEELADNVQDRCFSPAETVRI